MIKKGKKIIVLTVLVVILSLILGSTIKFVKFKATNEFEDYLSSCYWDLYESAAYDNMIERFYEIIDIVENTSEPLSKLEIESYKDEVKNLIIKVPDESKTIIEKKYKDLQGKYLFFSANQLKKLGTSREKIEDQFNLASKYYNENNYREAMVALNYIAGFINFD